MKYVRFGSTNINVSAIALGCADLGLAGQKNNISTILHAYENGINLFDTADVYQNGQSEFVLGQALKDGKIPREKVIISTKCGIVHPNAKNKYTYRVHKFSPKYIKLSCERSLKRLGVDYIDIYQPHHLDYLSHPYEIASAFENLKSEGKIRCVGVSNYDVDDLRTLSSFVRLETLQTQFSLLHPQPLDSGLYQVCLEKEISLLCWAPLNNGVLTDAVDLSRYSDLSQHKVGVITQIRKVANRYNGSTSQIALAWLMKLPGRVIPLVGSMNQSHISDAIESVNIELRRDDWYELTVISKGQTMPWSRS